MKRILLSVTIFIMIIGLVGSLSLMGCKEEAAEEVTEEAAEEVTEEAAEEAAEEEAVVVASEDEVYVMNNVVSGVPFWEDHRLGWADAGAALGVTAEYLGPLTGDISEQTKIMDDLIARKVAGIALCPSDPNALNPAVARAREAGIAVVIHTTPAADSEGLCYLGSSNYDMAAEAAKVLAEAIGGKGQVGISYAIGTLDQEERLAAYTDVFAAEYPDIEIVQAVDDKYDMAIGTTAVTGMLQKYPDIVGIGGCNATSAAAAAQAAKELDLNAGDIKIVAMDANNDTLALIMSDWILMTAASRTYSTGF